MLAYFYFSYFWTSAQQIGDGRSTLPAIRLNTSTYIPPNYPYLGSLSGFTGLGGAGLGGFSGGMPIPGAMGVSYVHGLSGLSGFSGSPHSSGSGMGGSPECTSPSPFHMGPSSATNAPNTSHKSRPRISLPGPRERSSSTPNVAHHLIRLSPDSVAKFEVSLILFGLFILFKILGHCENKGN